MHAIAKIIARHANREHVEVGEIVNVVPDFVMLNDRGAARAADLLRQMGGDKVFDPSRVIVVFDHHYPPIRQQDSVSQKKTREWIEEQKITKFHAGEGIGHVIFPEKGYAFPGALIFGTDSHTVTNSALGCVATGWDIPTSLRLAISHNWLRVRRFPFNCTASCGRASPRTSYCVTQLYGRMRHLISAWICGPLVREC
jgi:homoaconitase/3-isopropylmalate dehydratase large subunit